MEQIAITQQPIQPPPVPLGLPGDRQNWPDEARRAFRDVVHELDRWCREHDWPTASNAWVAEEAVRRSW